jgi:hypothetical protein
VKMSREQFEDLESEGFDLREDYSGRGMFGRECIGLTGDVTDLVRFTLRITDPENEWRVSNNEWLLDIRSDSMGYDMIFYWPAVSVEKEEEAS